jgi:hypothetical protein
MNTTYGNDEIGQEEQIDQNLDALQEERAEIDQDEQQLLDSDKSTMELALEMVASRASERESENNQQEIMGIAYFLNNYIRNKQNKQLEEKLSTIRKNHEILESRTPLIEMEVDQQSDQLIRNDNSFGETGLSEEEETKLSEENIKHYIRARDYGHNEYMEKAKKCYDFYIGKQWSESDLRYLREVKRPALTTNRILSVVNSILALKIKQGSTLIAQATSLEDTDRAEVLTKVLMYICRRNKFTSVENQAFKDALVTGRGFVESRISFDDNIEGEIVVKRVNPEEVVLDPDSSGNDPLTWGQVITTKWLSLNDVSLQYGEKKAKEVKDKAMHSTFRDDLYMFADESNNYFSNNSIGWNYNELDPEDNQEMRCVRVISRQYKKYITKPHFLDLSTKDCRPIPSSWERERVESFAKKNQYAILNKKTEVIRWTTTAGNVVLQDSWSPYKTFTITPIFCYSSGSSNTFGIVENLISPQEQLNKIESQETHVINTTANSGWVVEENSLANMSTEELAQNGSTSGIVLEYKRNTKNAPLKIQPNNIPNGLAHASQKASENITLVSGIDSAFLGIGKASSTSEATLERKFSQVKDGYSVLNDQLNIFRTSLGERMIEMLQTFYNDNRVFTISDPHKHDEGFEKIVINQAHPIEDSIINDISIGDYSIAIRSFPEASTLDNMMFDQIMSMKQAGIEIPNYRAVLASDLINKREIAEELKAIEGLQPPSEEEQQLEQIKTQAAIEEMKLNLQKLQAEIQKITSESMLNGAKAQIEVAKPDMANIQHEVTLTEAKINSDLRTALSDNSLQADLAKSAMSNEAGIQKELIKANASNNVEQQKGINQLSNKYLGLNADIQMQEATTRNKIIENYEKEKAKKTFDTSKPIQQSKSQKRKN